MTQDQCLDNGHQATSNNHSPNDQVSDDLNNAKNSIVSNGVNSVQEFNVDVNSKRSENRADVAIVQNRIVEIDADSPPSGKVFATSEQPAATSSDIVNSSVNSNNFIIATDVKRSECSNNILLADMTVITHQNSSENIRDIIANSDQVNKDVIDSQITEVDINVKSEQHFGNGNSANKSGATKNQIISSKREKSNKDESNKPEDPIARLNKLRASISSALSEVKGVLKQYSTEQSLEGENESTPSSQQAEDGPVRFRFVRKIRRRSAYSEDDTTPQKNGNSQEVQSETTSTDNTVAINDAPKQNDDHFSKILSDDAKHDTEKTSSMIIKKEVVADEVPYISKGEPVPCPTEDNHEIKSDSSHIINALPQVNTSLNLQQNVSDVILIQTKLTAQSEKIQSHTVTAPIKENDSANNIVKPNLISPTPHAKASEEIKRADADVVSKKIKQTPQKPDPSVQTTPGNTTIKAKNVKLKKVVKKDRRASIAAVEANQVLPDKSLPPLELKTQRRPSDSGTLVKHPPLVRQKATINEKSKLPPQRPVKAAAASKTEAPAVPASNIAAIQPSQRAFSSEKTKEPSQSKTILPTSAHEQILAAQANELPLKQEKNTSAIKVDVPTVTESKKELPSQSGIQTQSKLISPTVIHNEISVTETNKAPSKVEIASITETGNESHQSVVVASVPPSNKSQKKVTETNKTLSKVEITSITQTANESHQSVVVASVPVADKSQMKVSSETSIVNKIENNAGSDEKSTKINELLPAKQTEDDQTMPTSEKTTVPAPNQTVEVHTAIALPKPSDDGRSDEAVNETNLKDQTKAEEHMRFEEGNAPPSKCETPPEVPSVPTKKKRKAKRKVVIRRIKRKLSREDTFIHTQEAPPELEIEEKEIEEKDIDDEEEDEADIVPKQRKPCLKARQFEIGDVVMYAERYRKTQVKWKKAIVIERITSISYKLDIDGEEKPAHISYIKKFTNRKVNFGGKEYLEIDYAQIEEDEEKERNYSIWNLV